MRWVISGILALGIAAGQSAGPASGSLVVIGGGEIGPEIMQRFLQLAGGREAPVVYIPTAGDFDNYPPDFKGADFLRTAGFKRIAILHTRDHRVANTDAFVAPLKAARVVFFGGGRQWRLVEVYGGTQTEREIRAVLDRGGVIAGTSAGASIQASFLVRGAREGNEIMIASEFMRGFGYLRNVAVDQHLIPRKREKDLLQVTDRFPELLGIGIDEGTAIVVQGNFFEVVGCSSVAIYDHGYRAAPGQPRYYWLTPGVRFDLARRVRLDR